MYKSTSKIQSIAGEAIRFWFQEYVVIENHRPNWLFGMELDFYVPSFMLGIEIQGGQHDHYVQKFHRSKKDFQKQVERDKKKRELCKQNSVVLVEASALLELGWQIRKNVRGIVIGNLPTGLFWKMKEYDQAQKFISENQWVTQDINKKRKK